MKKLYWKWLVLSVIVLGLGMVSLWAQTEPQKITVKSEGATIHAKNDAESQVIERPAVGTVYEVVRKIGDWYEIKLPSRLGMVITGFIHEKFIEAEKAVVEEKKVVTEEKVSEETPPPPRKAKIGHVSLGGLYQFLHMGYDNNYPWRIFNQDGKIYDALYDQNVFGFQVGLGVSVLKNIEVELGFSSISKSLESFYAMDFPNFQLLNDIAYSEKFSNSKMSAMMFNLGLNYFPLKNSRLQPFLGAGVSYISGKFELLDDIIFRETFYLNKTHDIEITEVKLAGKTVDTLGYYAKLGIDFVFIEALSVFVEGRYLIAKKDVVHPLATKIANGQEQFIEINLGGASAVLGVKIRF